VAAEPWLNVFPLFAALTYLALVGGLLRRAASLGGLVLDWVAAFGFGASAFAAALAANLLAWNTAGEVAAAAASTAAGVAFLGAFTGMVNRYAGGWLGSPRFRLVTFAVALAMGAFGWGALAGGGAAPGDGATAPWVVVPVALGFVGMVPFAFLAARRGLSRGGQSNTLQLFLGVLLLGAGLVTLAVGDMTTGSALGVIGGAFMYSGASALSGLAPEPGPQPVPAATVRVQRGRTEPGRKVRVPKGKAVEVSAFRDDGLPPNQ
jgi:hypothetical protein